MLQRKKKLPFSLTKKFKYLRAFFSIEYNTISHSGLVISFKLFFD